MNVLAYERSGLELGFDAGLLKSRVGRMPRLAPVIYGEVSLADRAIPDLVVASAVLHEPASVRFQHLDQLPVVALHHASGALREGQSVLLDEVQRNLIALMRESVKLDKIV